MRLGGPVFTDDLNPDTWTATLKEEGYRAAVFPVDHEASEEEINGYVNAAESNDILLAEVGAWSNPISPDKVIRKAAMDKCKRQLDLAERTGARVCVNIAGARGGQWDGPHEENFSEETFEMIVDSVREIIDAVNPKRTFYTLETLPWIFPDSADSYLELIRAIDRKAFAVHLDPVNMISSPRVYYRNGEFIKECFKKLGPYIKSCHAKDIRMSGDFMVHLDEVLPGTGTLNYKVLLTELNKLDHDIPVILEHLTTPEEYRQAASYVRGVAKELKIEL
ncbi:sugar phosphate isomerase/epimerase [Bacillus salacetis]|uniref:Sugar phosphate isomerase/epimerase n=2 Tax=Bacillus salacetis TaxID=2315464 RepID=A0A3A1QYZ9_9BACI|nr:sugar phosphate isomerase/epimerase [Bacillus salacetis]